MVVRAKGLEPPRLSPPDPKSGVSTNSTTPALKIVPVWTDNGMLYNTEAGLETKSYRVCRLNQRLDYNSFSIAIRK